MGVFGGCTKLRSGNKQQRLWGGGGGGVGGGWGVGSDLSKKWFGRCGPVPAVTPLSLFNLCRQATCTADTQTSATTPLHPSVSSTTLQSVSGRKEEADRNTKNRHKRV